MTAAKVNKGHVKSVFSLFISQKKKKEFYKTVYKIILVHQMHTHTHTHIMRIGCNALAICIYCIN